MPIIRVPKDEILYRSALTNPDNFIRDIACWPRTGIAPFIRRRKKIKQAIGEYPNPFNPDKLSFDEGFKPGNKFRRYLHIDLSYNHDAVGIAMAHAPGFVEIEVIEQKMNRIIKTQAPLVKVDFWGKIKCGKGEEIILADIREIVYELSRLGFYIGLVTFDRFQSIDSVQILRSYGYTVAHQSIDRSANYIVVNPNSEFGFERKSTEGNYNAAINSVKDTLYGDRLQLPYSLNRYEKDWFVEEATDAQETKSGKIDHPPQGSIDVLHAVAGATYHVLNNERMTVTAQSEAELEAMKDTFYSERINRIGKVDKYLMSRDEGYFETMDPRDIS